MPKKATKVSHGSKRNSFKELWEEADINPGRKAHRAGIAKLKGSPVLQSKRPVLLQIIVTTLFPQKSIIAIEREHLPNDIPIKTSE